MTGDFTKPVVEDASLACLESLGYAVLLGHDIAVGTPAAEPACAPACAQRAGWCPHADRRGDPSASCGETLTDIHNCLQNVMRPYLEAVA